MRCSPDSRFGSSDGGKSVMQRLRRDGIIDLLVLLTATARLESLLCCLPTGLAGEGTSPSTSAVFVNCPGVPGHRTSTRKRTSSSPSVRIRTVVCAMYGTRSAPLLPPENQTQPTTWIMRSGWQPSSHLLMARSPSLSTVMDGTNLEDRKNHAKERWSSLRQVVEAGCAEYLYGVPVRSTCTREDLVTAFPFIFPVCKLPAQLAHGIH